LLISIDDDCESGDSGGDPTSRDGSPGASPRDGDDRPATLFRRARTRPGVIVGVDSIARIVLTREHESPSFSGVPAPRTPFERQTDGRTDGRTRRSRVTTHRDDDDDDDDEADDDEADGREECCRR
jgi:hypothetical protein